jgi:FlaA1/EpsC-like NDP-sugar epimerase
MIVWLRNLSRNSKRLLALSVDILTLPISLWLSFTLRFEEVYSPDVRIATVIALTTVTSVAVFIRLGLYRAVIRYAGLQLFNTIFIGVSISVFLFAFLGFLFQTSLPKSVPFIYFGISLIAVSSTRLLIRHILTFDLRHKKKKVIIYGSGSAGLQLSNALLQGLEYQPVAFLDDDKHKQGSIINGLRVYKPRKLGSLVSEFGAEEVLLAISTLTPSRRGQIVHSLTEFNIKVKTIPGMLELIDGTSKIEEIRNLKVEELLGREQVPPDPLLLKACVMGKSVMVTGAGGSIGSELCRQIAEIGPSQLIMLETSEFALYSIEQELLQKSFRFPILPMLGNVQEEKLVLRILKKFSVETIYHAAAYKHVPLVEQNLVSGVSNNVLGTYATAQAARTAGVKNFILISTDKAVRPTNIMGATKRVAEQILQNLAESNTSSTIFTMVRFGNVLASSGSVIPKFKQQIESGGPVTVTHPEITRYFMTIPEAVQLVIQAGTLGEGGDVFVLDMGEPVKIKNLAETIIVLLGKSIRTNEFRDGEIEIKYTGLRPGEKLYEELLIGENCVGTAHPMITRAIESKLTSLVLDSVIECLREACSKDDLRQIVHQLELAVPEYSASKEVLEQISKSETAKPIILSIKP